MSDRTNRRLLGLLGLVCLAGGLLGLAARSGHLTLEPPGVLYQHARQDVVQTPQLWWPLLLVASLLLIIAGAYWLGRELDPRPATRPRTILLNCDPRGRTEIRTAGVEAVLDADLARRPEILSGRSRILTWDGKLEMATQLTIAANATIAGAVAAAEPAFTRLAETLDISGADVAVDIRVMIGQQPLPRVRPRPPRPSRNGADRYATAARRATT